MYNFLNYKEYPKQSRVIIKDYIKEVKSLKFYLLAIGIITIISYSLYFFCNESTLEMLGAEDGLFEWITAFLFFISSILFFLVFLRTKNFFVLGLAIICFIGTGEELSWGQRIFSFVTPESINKVNVQGEFNLHNLEVFNGEFLNREKKEGFERIFEINVLFRIFSMFFLVFTPLVFYYFQPKIFINKKWQIPVAPFTLGIFFIISWILFYSMKYYYLPLKEKGWGSICEVFEATVSFIYCMVALYFFKRKDNAFLGKDIKHITCIVPGIYRSV